MDISDGTGAEAMMWDLLRMAACGPPMTFEDRTARNVLANPLRLPPEVYNCLFRRVSSTVLIVAGRS